MYIYLWPLCIHLLWLTLKNDVETARFKGLEVVYQYQIYLCLETLSNNTYLNTLPDVKEIVL